MEKKIDAGYRAELEKNGVIGFVPGGNSMWPTLKNKGQSVIVLKKERKLKRFDVALYQRKCGTYVLHRVMEPTSFGYLMCGDSQFDIERVQEDQVFGVMSGFYRGEKYIECTDAEYIKEVEKWFGNEKRRKRKLKAFFTRIAIRHKLNVIFKVLTGRRKKGE